LHNLSGREQQLKLDLEGSAGLSFERPEREVTLEDQEKTSLRFLVSADSYPWLANIRLRVSGQDIEMERDFPLQIEATTTTQTDTESHVIEPGQSFDIKSIAAEKDWHPGTESASMVINNSPPIDIRKHIRGLLVYPYGCTEQTTSSSYPHVFIDEETARQFGLQPFTREKRVAMLDKSIAKLAGMQVANGAFSLWGNVSNYEFWLTAYVTQFLQDARSQGFSVPEDVYRRATDFLLKEIGQNVATLAFKSKTGQSRGGSWQHDWNQRNHHYGVLAYGAYVLAQDQKVSLATLRQLYDARSHAPGGLALIQLGIALQQMGDGERAKTVLAEGVKKTRAHGEGWHDYGSELRDTALSYALLKKHKLSVADRSNLLARLHELLKNNNYPSTQERFAVFLAGRDLTEFDAKSWSATLQKGETTQNFQQQKELFVNLTHEDFAAGIRLVNHSDHTLYVEMSRSAYTKKAPPEGGKIKLKRAYFDGKGNPLSSEGLKTGETVWVKLTASSRINAPNALIVDRIPAGLEIENTHLIEGETGASLWIDGMTPALTMNDQRIVHKEFRDDRFVAAVRLGQWWHNEVTLFYRARVVTPGVFRVPPLSAEDMYNPEIRGSFGGGDVMVIDKAIMDEVPNNAPTTEPPTPEVETTSTPEVETTSTPEVETTSTPNLENAPEALRQLAALLRWMKTGNAD
jgi:uncharacterized protein YfaS (alpha-2-macroglobulin family)